MGSPRPMRSSPENVAAFFLLSGPQGPHPLHVFARHLRHEATHALVDGLRPRYMEPSSPDQAAFHEGFADVVALLSVFSVRGVVEYAVSHAGVRAGARMITVARLTIDALQNGVLLGLGEQFGEALSGIHGTALRRSVTLKPSTSLKNAPEYLEEHTRGELLVASVLRAFLSAYHERLKPSAGL